jgi:hypothetical protein
VLSSVAKIESRTSDEILHRLGDENLARSGESRDASARDDRDAGELLAYKFAFARVNPGADVEVARPCIGDDRLRTRDRARGAIEAAEEAVTGRVELVSSEPHELSSYILVMTRQ